MITKEIKKQLKSYGWKVESETPLKISNENGEYRTGILAQMLVDEAIAENEEEAMADPKKVKQLLKSLNDNDKLLVIANLNYADEFDIMELQIMTVEEYKAIHDFLMGYKDEIEWYFGSNEDFRFDNGADLLSNFTIKKISDEEAEVIIRVIGDNFGSNNVFSEISEMSNADDENEDDENEEDESDEAWEAREFLKVKNKFATLGWTIEKENEHYILKNQVSGDENRCDIYTLIDDEIFNYLKRKK